jgi:wyosine [tRNA(Phe)-imidazoG37] synthetase (radical SAM superfamily)
MAKKIQPRLIYADLEGNIFDHPHLLMLCRKGAELTMPSPQDLIPLPRESELFLLPQRNALGFDPESGHIEALEHTAVSAFVSPGHTLTGLSAFLSAQGSPRLPLFAYGAVGYANGRFWVCARRVDRDTRQQFSDIPQARIEAGAQRWLKAFPDNRLVRHLARCALTSCCPAARNLALGRFEAPLPTARGCNAACVGCISEQPPSSGFPATQSRISFRPSAREITQIMHSHAASEKRPIFSFGQGCEGEPLLESETIRAAVASYRARNGRGTVNINTNASRPETLPGLAEAGLDSMRVSLNSAREAIYQPYYRPRDYSLSTVATAVAQAKELGLFVSLNLLFFPGISDTESELQALSELIDRTRLDFIQLRNLNLDPELYLELLPEQSSPAMGLANFMVRLEKEFPWIAFGYFNPYVASGRDESPG